MWRWMVMAVVLWAGWLPAAQAAFDRLDGWRIVVQRGYDRQESRRGERRNDQRDQREQRRRADRDQRESLTPDEHRELNRDLKRANREFYRKGGERR